MSENTRQGLKELAKKLNVTLEYLVKHLADDRKYPL